MKVYVLIHTHKQGTTVNCFKTLDSAEQIMFTLQSEECRELNIDFDDALDNDTLSQDLAIFGSFYEIQETELN